MANGAILGRRDINRLTLLPQIVFHYASRTGPARHPSDPRGPNRRGWCRRLKSRLDSVRPSVAHKRQFPSSAVRCPKSDVVEGDNTSLIALSRTILIASLQRNDMLAAGATRYRVGLEE